jgi:hypothetical protein
LKLAKTVLIIIAMAAVQRSLTARYVAERGLPIVPRADSRPLGRAGYIWQ